jgi:acetyltransferase-like isoleucine patch superfamily enzyme
MPLKITDQGQGNRISIPPSLADHLHGAVVIKGSNNTLEIGEECSWASLLIQLGSDCHISIGRNCLLGRMIIFAQCGARTVVGDRCIVNGLMRLLSHEAALLRLGADCLFADQVDVAVSDMHSIVDLASGMRINAARDVVVGDHVWVGQRSLILKGTRIGSGSIIGAGSIVAGEIPRNVVAAGSPARVIREGVAWEPDLI